MKKWHTFLDDDVDNNRLCFAFRLAGIFSRTHKFPTRLHDAVVAAGAQLPSSCRGYPWRCAAPFGLGSARLGQGPVRSLQYQTFFLINTKSAWHERQASIHAASSSSERVPNVLTWWNTHLTAGQIRVSHREDEGKTCVRPCSRHFFPYTNHHRVLSNMILRWWKSRYSPPLNWSINPTAVARAQHTKSITSFFVVIFITTFSNLLVEKCVRNMTEEIGSDSRNRDNLR